MPTIIDSLVVELGLDPKKFIGGQKEVEATLKRLIENAGKGSTEIERRTKSTIDYFEHIKRGLLTTIGVFLGGKGAKDFLNFITTSDAATGRFSDTIGLNIQKLGAWENALKSMGGSAESARGAFGGLNADIKAFEAGTGGGQFIQILEALGVKAGGKPVDQILLEAAAGAKRRHPGDKNRQAFELGQIPGMNQDMINFLLLEEAEIKRRLARGGRAAPSEDDRKRAEEYQEATSQFTTAVERFSSAIAYLTSGPLATVLNKLTDLVEGWMGKGKHAITDQQQHDKLRGMFGAPPAGLAAGAAKFGAGVQGLLDKGVTMAPGAPTKPPGAREQIGYIRSAALARGINPDIAVEVAKREGLYNWKSSIPGEESYGPFQLHYGGRGQKGPLAAKGLGDDFTKQTGLDAADPANWKAGVDFALDSAKRQGWGAWYGWKGEKWAGIPVGAAAARGGGTTVNRAGSTSSVNISQVTVNTRATDAMGIARDFSAAVARNAVAAPVNFGQE